MIEISKSIEQGFGNGGLYDVLRQLQNMAVPITQTKVYYVCKGGNNVDGLSWETAYTTLEAAITEQRRMRATLPSAEQSVNTYIIIAPGDYDENITSLPFSCTMIGLGIPGTDKAVEWNTTAGACISGTVSGLRLVNIRFEAGGAFNLLDFNVSNNVEILNCEFECKDTDNLAAIANSGGAGFMTIRGCKFGSQLGTRGFDMCLDFNSWFSAAVIENNIFDGLDPTGTAISIYVNSVGYGAVIRNNIIRLDGAGMGIDDDSDDAMCLDNVVFHVGGTPYDINASLSKNNYANDDGTATIVPDLAQF